jgi:hypothetical protein
MLPPHMHLTLRGSSHAGSTCHYRKLRSAHAVPVSMSVRRTLVTTRVAETGPPDPTFEVRRRWRTTPVSLGGDIW